MPYSISDSHHGSTSGKSPPPDRFVFISLLRNLPLVERNLMNKIQSGFRTEPREGGGKK
jgi:hypothetical protein